MEQSYNPFLPLTTYIPDGEPHVFGDRLYLYGSHDRAGGKDYCEDHYEVWSASVTDLSDWRCEGTSYLRNQDPSNADDTMRLFAPDVARGVDGRYYLYYAYSAKPEIGVAVSERPEGPFSYYGHVHYPVDREGGRVLTEHMPFDPAVFVDEDGRVYLYYGFAPACEKEMRIEGAGEDSYVAELMQDMVTLKEAPRPLIPGGHHTAGTGFEGHGFFEASSMRKIRGRYYFIYSSHKSHELCYAISDRPDSGFTYGGTILSNGDLGYQGREKPVYPIGNVHGSIEEVNGALYVFYHRQTHGTEYSRQACAERIEIMKDGHIPQVEITSCGLNGAPLAGNGSYPAAIACHLADRSILPVIRYEDPAMREKPQVTERGGMVYLTNIRNRTTVGYKYFQFTDADLMTLEVRGEFAGTVTVAHDLEGKIPIGQLELDLRSKEWEIELIPITPASGKHPLYLYFKGKGSLEIKTLGFVSA